MLHGFASAFDGVAEVFARQKFMTCVIDTLHLSYSGTAQWYTNLPPQHLE